MADVVKLKRGLDLHLDGEADKVYREASTPKTLGIQPDDFYGMVPKPVLKPGDAVKVGTVLIEDKRNPRLKVVSPVSGTLAAINRGERRKIMSIEIANDEKMEAEQKAPLSAGSSADEIKQTLSETGMLAFFRQRPYDVVINPSDTPKAIFVSAFDCAPLAPDYDFVYASEIKAVQAAIDVLAKLAPVYVGVKPGSVFEGLKNATVTVFDGKYPASNVGVQINHTNPINKGEIAWTIGLPELLYIGRYALCGKLDFTKAVALAGPEATTPSYYVMLLGQNIAEVVNANAMKGDLIRIVAGNPLSGHQVESNVYLPPFVSQITLLRDGADVNETLGWIMPRFGKYSRSGTYLSRFLSIICPSKTYKFDTRIMGGHRNMIFSGEYDKVFPMDIYPEYLIKAILAGNIDKMEALGIYEVAPEDFAAAEFVDSSKLELQRIVREGLDMLRKEMC